MSYVRVYYFWVIACMISLLWRTDVHISDESPISRLDNWADTVLNKLRQVNTMAEVYEVQAILDGGDFFHVKSPVRNSHALIQSVASLGSPVPILANVGNHDVKYGDLRFLNESPLGVLFSSGVFRRCYQKYEWYIQRNSAEISYSATYLEGFEETVRVVGVPYHGTIYNNDFLRVKKGREDRLVVMAHLLASQDGGTMFEGEDIVSYDILKDCDADVFCFGHWHKDQGITEISDGKFVVNIGSLTRGSLSQDDIDRTPSVALLKLSKSSVQCVQIPLKVSPAVEVFNMEGKARLESKEIQVNSFLATLQQLQHPTEGSVEDWVRSLEITAPVKEAMLHYLDEAKAA